MLATFVIEFGLLFYTLWRYKMNTTGKLVAAFLGTLGTFQLAEYMTCGGLGMGHYEWVQLGYIAITLLPALGMHMVASLSKINAKPLIIFAYATAAAYSIYFAFAGGAIIARECSPNYAIFDLRGNGYLFYGAYYYGWLLFTAGMALYQAKLQPKKASLLRWMVAGYAVFVVPTTIANLVDPKTLQGIPSIMCGFAILLAIILVWKILPLAKVPVIRDLDLAKQRRA
jgi:hypothetical protein